MTYSEAEPRINAIVALVLKLGVNLEVVDPRDMVFDAVMSGDTRPDEDIAHEIAMRCLYP